MLQLAKEIIELTNSKSEIVFEDLPGDDPRDREPDISKAKNLLSWNPEVTRKDGLQKTIEDLRAQLQIV
jgi:nucleoside-diphosphate-sugar epimerase